jgi:hypothetical protein
MCSTWKRTFTLAPLVPLTMFSPMVYGLHLQSLFMFENHCVWFWLEYSAFNISTTNNQYVFPIHYTIWKPSLLSGCLFNAIHVYL